MEQQDRLQEELQATMRLEIGATREILANMRQEESCLLHGDQPSWTLIMLERATMLERLYRLRSERANLAPSAPCDSCELLFMGEQLTALLVKMNEQNVRNQALEARLKHSLPAQRLAQPMALPKPSRTTVTTYPPAA